MKERHLERTSAESFEEVICGTNENGYEEIKFLALVL